MVIRDEVSAKVSKSMPVAEEEMAIPMPNPIEAQTVNMQKYINARMSGCMVWNTAFIIGRYFS